MDNEFLKWLMSLGVGGVIAGLMIFFYRKDIRSYTELWRETSLTLASERKEIAIMYSALLEKSTSAHTVNSETNREIISLLSALHRRLDIQHVPPAASPGPGAPTKLI